MKNNLHKALVIILLLFMNSCEREILLKDKENLSEPVLDCIFYGDSFLNVNFSLSQSITNNKKPTIVNNATIELFDKDTNLIELLTYSGEGNYKTLFNKTNQRNIYLLKTSYSNKVIWAFDSVPIKPQIKRLDTFKMIFQGRQNYFNMIYNLKDSFNFKEYYGIRIQKRYLLKLTPTDSFWREEFVDVISKDFAINEDENYIYNKKWAIFSDKQFNSRNLILNIGSHEIFEIGEPKPHSVVVYFYSLSSQAYQYYSSINKHLYYKKDPFTNSPQINGNLSNGFGAFVGLNIFSDTIKIK